MAGGAQRFLGFQVGFGINDRPLTQADRRVDSFKNNVIRATDRMGALERKAVTAGRAISSAFHDAKKQISNGVAVLERYRYQLGIAAGMGFAAIGKSVFSAADANETVNKFNVVFGEVANQTRKWADEYAQDIGRSEYATLGWLNSFQDVLVPMGLARDQAAGLSKEMVTLAANLGSFNNVATSSAAEAMQSALVGNHEAVRMLGIQLSEAQLNLVAQREGYQKNFRDLDNLTKMQLRFQEMIRQSGDAVGDATRTAMEFNNQWLRFKGNIRDVSIAMGFSFIPSFNKGLIITNKFLEKLEESEKLQAATRFFAIGVAITGISAAIGAVSAAWPFIAGIFSISSFGIAAAVTGIVLAIEDLWVGLNGGESTLLPIINKFLAWTGINKDLKGVLRDVGDAALWTWEAIKASFAYIEPLVQSTVVGAVKIFEGAFKILFSPIKAISGLIKGIVTGDFGMYMDAVDQFYSGVGDIFDGIKTIVTAKLNFVGNAIVDVFQLSKIPDLAGFIKEKFIDAVNYVKDNPLTLVRFLIPTVNLPEIINKIYEAGRQFIKDKTGIELPEIKLPTLPDLVGAVKEVWNLGKSFINNSLIMFPIPESFLLKSIKSPQTPTFKT
jgi:VIT1/CCC1 family predicted Fe2+/Mn2+ transporter